MRVEATAPRPTVSTPRRPVAGAMVGVMWFSVEVQGVPTSC
jgi:hypothetical protein